MEAESGTDCKSETTVRPSKVLLERMPIVGGRGGLTQTVFAKKLKAPVGESPMKGSYRELSSSRVEITLGCERRTMQFMVSGGKLTLCCWMCDEVYARIK